MVLLPPPTFPPNTIITTDNSPTVTGNQSNNALPWLPGAILALANGIPSASQPQDAAWDTGLAMFDATNKFAAQAWDNNGVTPSSSRRSATQAHALSTLNSTTTHGLVADLVSFNANGYTLNWTTVQASFRTMVALAIASTVNSKVINFQTRTGTGTQAITGAGFAPTAAIFILSGTVSLDTIALEDGNSIGIANTTQQRGLTIAGQDTTSSASAFARAARSDNTLVRINTTSISMLAAVQSFDADGLTLNFGTGEATARYAAVLLLKGVQTKIGSFNQPIATGAQTITGVPFQPRTVLFFSTAKTAGTTAVPDAALQVGGVSNTTPLQQWAWGLMGTWNILTQLRRVVDLTHCLTLVDPATGAAITRAAVTSVNADGFTLNWDTVDATAREIFYMALD